MNGVTSDEYVRLISTFLYIYDTEGIFNCLRCKKKLSRHKSELVRAKKGCFSPINEPWYHFKTNSGMQEVKFALCPGNLYDYEMEYLIQCHDHYEKTGEYPFGIQMCNVPAKIVEIFNLIYNLKIEDRESKTREASKNGKRNSSRHRAKY